MPNLPHTCPRCGYDLSGVVDARHDRCPLAGVCSECGLEFQWGDLLNPRLNVPRWSFEHAPRRFVRAFAGTVGRTLLVYPLWRRLDIANPIEPRRLVVFAVLLIALTHVTAGGVNAWHAGGMQELARSTLHSNARFRATPKLNADLAARVFVRPFRPWTYTPATGGSWVGRSAYTTRTPAYLWLMLGPVAAFPFAFLLLWQTRGRAQIRPGHALRIGVHSLAIMPVFMIAWAFRDNVGGSAWRWYGFSEIVFSGWVLAPIAAFVWLSLYWLVAMRWYLRLRAWASAWLATTAVAAAITACVLAFYLAA